jgi:hypothetical protein
VNIVTLNWQRPLWEGDQEVMKRSGRDEPTWVAIYMHMEGTLGTSLYSYYLLCFLFNKIGEQEDGTGSAWKWGLGGWVGGRWPKQAIHM